MPVGLPFNPYQRFQPFVSPEETQDGFSFVPPQQVQQTEQPSMFEQVDDQSQTAGQADPAFDWKDYQSSDAIERRHKLATAIMGQQQEVNHPMQALGNVAAQLSGAWMEKKAQEAEDNNTKMHNEFMQQALKGAGGDMDKFIEQLASSPNPDDVDKALQYKIALLKRRGGDGKTDIIDVYGEDGRTRRKALVDTETGEIIRYVGGQAPLYKPSSGGGGGLDFSGSGGDASMDDDGSNGNPLLMDDATADFWAEAALAGDTTATQNLGRGKAGAYNALKVKRAIARKAQEIDPKTGKPRFNARQVAAARYNLQGYGAGVRTSNTVRAKMLQRAHEAYNMMDNVVSSSKKVPRSNYSDIAWVQNQWRSRTGDPNIVAFTTALNSLVNSYAAAISPNGGTVSDKEHARDILAHYMSQGQIEAGIDMMKREIEAAIESGGEAIGDQERAWAGEGEITAPRSEERGSGLRPLPRVGGKVDPSQMEEGIEYDAGPRHPGKKLVKKNGQVFEVDY